MAEKTMVQKKQNSTSPRVADVESRNLNLRSVPAQRLERVREARILRKSINIGSVFMVPRDRQICTNDKATLAVLCTVLHGDTHSESESEVTVLETE